MSIESVMPSNHLILCRPLLLPSIFPSIRVFSNWLTLHIRWPKYWSFSFSISPSNEYLGLISFRMDWFDHWFAVAQLHPRLHLHLALSVESPLCLQISPYTDIECRAHPNPVWPHLYSVTSAQSQFPNKAILTGPRVRISTYLDGKGSDSTHHYE